MYRSVFLCLCLPDWRINVFITVIGCERLAKNFYRRNHHLTSSDPVATDRALSELNAL